MYCRNCGSELMEGVTFCAKCGAKCVTTQEIPIEDHVETSSEENLTKHFGKKIAISIIAVVGIILIAVVGLVSNLLRKIKSGRICAIKSIPMRFLILLVIGKI